MICYETELLQLIQYDATEIQNPIHTLQNLFEDLHILTEEQFYTAVKLLCKQEYLMEYEFWKFSKSVTAIVFGMLMVSISCTCFGAENCSLYCFVYFY